MQNETATQIHESLQKVFRDVFQAPNLVISDEMTARDVPAWDSLAHVELIVMVEKVFEVQLSTAAIGRMQNVGDFKRMLAKLKSSP